MIKQHRLYLTALEQPWIQKEMQERFDFFLQEMLDIWSHLKLESRAGKFHGKQCSVSFLSSFFLWREKGSWDIISGLVQIFSALTFLFKYTIVFCFCEFTV